MSSPAAKGKRPDRNRQRLLRRVAQPTGSSDLTSREKVVSPTAQHVATPSKPVSLRPVNPFPFFDLPGEIRNRIYDLVVPAARVIITGNKPQRELKQLKERAPKKNHKAPRHQLKGQFTDNPTASSLLFACRQMNRESVQYVYARTTFCIQSFVVLRKFLNKIPEAGRTSILSLEITHRGYGEPSMLADREWKLRHDAKWASVLKRVKQETALRELVLDVTNFDWPIQLELRESWAKPLLDLAGGGLDRVNLTLESDSFPVERCLMVEKELECRMTNASGRREKRREEQLKATAEKKRLEESKRKATKVLTISLPNGIPQTSGPAKKVVKSKGLEKFAVAQPLVAFC